MKEVRDLRDNFKHYKQGNGRSSSKQHVPRSPQQIMEVTPQKEKQEKMSKTLSPSPKNLAKEVRRTSPKTAEGTSTRCSGGPTPPDKCRRTSKIMRTPPASKQTGTFCKARCLETRPTTTKTRSSERMRWNRNRVPDWMI